jgi:hypothetical protein
MSLPDRSRSSFLYSKKSGHSYFQENRTDLWYFKNLAVLRREKGNYDPPFGGKEVKRWSTIAQSTRSSASLRFSVSRYCGMKLLTLPKRSSTAGQGKERKFVSAGLGHFPTSLFAGAKDGSGYPLPMLATKLLSPY